jgi:hypothetical protein
MKTERKFVFSCKGEQQLSASLRIANEIAGVLKLFSLAAGVGAPAASLFTGLRDALLAPTAAPALPDAVRSSSCIVHRKE